MYQRERERERDVNNMDICLKKCGEKDIIGGIMDIHFAWYAIDWIHYNTHTHIWMKFRVYRNHCQTVSVYPWLCVRPTAFFVLWHFSHTMFGMWVYHRGTMCRMHSWPLYDLDLSPQYESYIFTMNLSLARFSLLFDRGIPNFGLWVYHHETKCFVHSWPLTYMWVAGVSIMSITHSI